MENIKRVIFTVGNKGGVGKTSTLVRIIDYIQERGTKIALYDLDEMQSLHRFFCDAKITSLGEHERLDTVVEELISSDIGATLLDLPASARHFALPWLMGQPFEMYASRGVRFTALAVVSPEEGSIGPMHEWFRALGDKVDWLVCKLAVNAGTPEKAEKMSFAAWEENPVTKQLRENPGFEEVKVPFYEDFLAGHLHTFGFSPRTAIQRATDGEKHGTLTSLANIHRLQIGQRILFDQLDKICCLQANLHN